jgi:ketosteroid isomerase-like protein
MSQENVEVGLQQVDAVNRRDADAFVATVSPDVEWEDSMFWSEVSRTYRGKAEVREWFNRVVIEPWASLHCEVEEITEAADDRVFFGGILTARGRDSGVDTQLRFWTVSSFADGMITRREVFRERAEALKTAGLEE